MHRGIMEALGTRAHDITMGFMIDKIHGIQTWGIYLLGTSLDIVGKDKDIQDKA
jgi:hypothetical protein